MADSVVTPADHSLAFLNALSAPLMGLCHQIESAGLVCFPIQEMSVIENFKGAEITADASQWIHDNYDAYEERIESHTRTKLYELAAITLDQQHSFLVLTVSTLAERINNLWEVSGVIRHENVQFYVFTDPQLADECMFTMMRADMLNMYGTDNWHP